jgi:diketogulonate reductase-like aldo/keto reductase
MTIPAVQLNDGTSIPHLGFGTYPWSGDSRTSTLTAIEAGYRLLDTALRYENEQGVGAAVRECGLPRTELLITSKIPGRLHGRQGARDAFAQSSAELGLDRIDLYLIHWPLPRLGRSVDTWRTMIELRDEGKVTSIGVSNFTPAQLERLQDETGVTPAVNQVELHPWFPQHELHAFHRAHGIVTESWSPLGRGELLADPAVVAIAAAHGVTPAQAILRWHVQRGIVPIPMSSDPGRQRENIDVFGFELTEAEMTRFSSMERGRIWGQDPDTHEEF